MLTPEQLAAIPERYVKLCYELENDVIADICRRIAQSEGNIITPSAEHQIIQLIEGGKAPDDIKEKIKSFSGMTQESIDSLYKEAAERSSRFEEEIYNKAGLSPIPLSENKKLQMIIAAQMKQTKGELKNISNSMGFAFKENGKTVFKPIAEAYQHAADKAHMAIVSGVFDHNAAIKNAVKELARSGLQYIDYESGHRNRLDVAVRRAVLTGVSQITSSISEMNANDMGVDIMEIDAHAGARPDHQEWQGQLVSRSGKMGYLSLNDIGYGTGSGFKGWNCRHDWYPYFEGISERAYTREQLENIDPPPFEYEGKVYNAYEATQQQRKIETAMRQTKRELIAYETAGLKDDYTASAIKLNRQRLYYKDFSEAAGLKLRSERAQAFGFGKGEAAKASSEARNYITSKVIGKADKKLLRAIENEYALISPEHRAIINKTVNKIILTDGISNYMRNEGIINLDREFEEGGLIHECAHALETAKDLYHNDEFLKILSNGLEDVGPFDIIEDTETFIKPIDILGVDCNKFISYYQRRIYDPDIDGNRILDYSTKEFNHKTLGEYFSEGYKEYYVNPNNLKEKDRKLYDFIRRLK